MGFFDELLSALFDKKKVENNKKIESKENQIVITQERAEQPKQEPTVTEQEENEELKEEIKSEKFPYILTNCVFNNKENKFYISVKKITDKYNLVLFTKMRIADLVYIPKNHEQYMRWFNYIKAKHVDFIICNSDLKPVLLIEVDDKTHDREKRIQRDEFVDKIFRQVNLPILHIRLWEDEELEKQIKEVLKIT